MGDFTALGDLAAGRSIRATITRSTEDPRVHRDDEVVVDTSA